MVLTKRPLANESRSFHASSPSARKCSSSNRQSTTRKIPSGLKAPSPRPLHSLPAPANRWNTPACLPPRHDALPHEESPAGALASQPGPRLQPPFDLRIVRQRTGAGAGNVGQYAIETRHLPLNIEHVRVDHFHIPGRNQFPQQPGTVRMQLQSNDAGLGIPLRQYPGLAPRRRATIQDSRSLAHQQRHQLRGLVLDRDPALSEGPSAGNISSSNPARRSQ